MSDGLEAYRKIVESIGRDSVAAVWHVLASSSSKAVPIKGADLFLLAGVHERVGTLAISHLRKAGVTICGNSFGYYLSTEKREAAKQAARYIRRAADCLETAAALLQSTENPGAQRALFEPDRLTLDTVHDSLDNLKKRLAEYLSFQTKETA